MSEVSSSVVEGESCAYGAGKEAGDAAFEAFLEAESAGLVGYLRGRRIEAEDAQDIAQDAQLRLLRYRGHDAGTLRPLLYRIALNLVRDRWRQHSAQRRELMQVQTLDVAILAQEQPGPDQLAMQRQELQRVREAIATLPAHCRGVYLLNRVEGMSYPEIARHLGVSVKAVEKQISKALALLRLAMPRT